MEVGLGRTRTDVVNGYCLMCVDIHEGKGNQCVCVCVCMRDLCVCVCERERERERDLKGAYHEELLISN